MVSSKTDSMIERKPRAPVLRAKANWAIERKADGKNSNSMPSMPNNTWYCFTKAFLGSVKISIIAASSNSLKVVMTGKRPINSGIKPNLIKSSGSTVLNNSPTDLPSSLLTTSAPKPMPPFSERRRMIFSKPSNAPPQINKILVVSTSMNS